MISLKNHLFLPAAFILCLSILHVNAQQGEPFMCHIKKDRIPGNKITAICEDLENIMVFTVNTGIITFDSEEWQVIQVPNIPMSLASDSILPLIYVGGRGFFGYLLKSDQGQYIYYDLGEDEVQNPGDIDLIHQTKKNVIYYGEDLIVIADRNELYRSTYYDADSSRIFSGLFIHGERAYVNLLGRGIYELSGGRFIKFEIEHDFAGSEILFGIHYHDSLTLIGLDDNRIFRFDGLQFKQVVLEDQQYLSESYLKSAAWLGGHRFALSTILGGCLIVDVSNGETHSILNYNTGLPDDEIFSMGTDQNKGLWLSHQYGLTRVDVGLPVRSFGHYPGLSGNLTAVAVLDSILYVGTHNAVFFLEEKKEFLEEEVVIKVQTPIAVASPQPAETAPETETEEEPPAEEDLSFWEQLKMNRQERRIAKRQERSGEESPGEAVPEDREPSSAEKDLAEPAEERQQDQPKGLKSLIARISGIIREEPDMQVKADPVSRTRYLKQKIYSLQSVSHEFTRIGDLDSRVKDMVTLGDRIIISTNAGLYEIIENQLKVVRAGWYVQGIFPALHPSRMHVVTDETAYTLELRDGQWQTAASYDFIDEEIYSVCEEKDSTIWLGCDNLTFRVRHLSDSLTTLHSFSFHEPFYDPVRIRYINDTVYFLLSGDIYYHMQDSLYLATWNGEQVLSRVYPSNNDITWIKSGEKWFSLKNQKNHHSKTDFFLNLFTDINDLFLDPGGNVWVLHENEHLQCIKGDKVPGYRPEFNIYLKSVYNETARYDLGSLQFGFYDRSMVFNFSAPFYLKESSTSYQYYLEGMSEDWSDWLQVNDLSFPVLPMGRFTMHVRARNVLNQITETRSYPIVIRPPYWLSWWFISLAALLLVTIVTLIIRWRVRKLQRDKQILEEKVRERTAEIRKQKDEIADQKKEIMDSINYAQRIQKAVLPSEETVKQTMPEHFILYLPRDVVSGDFYWVASRDGKIIFAAADCTGHGVPGAFMSMLGVSFLNEIFSKSGRPSCGRILDNLRSNVKETLGQSREGATKDGMDIALCILDQQKMKLQYAGAFNPLYLIRNSELTEYKADRMPIGIHFGEESNFRDHTIQLEKKDALYIFSDGFQDQIGGERGKKFLSKSMKALLTEVHNKPMEEQKQILQDALTSWMQGYQQVDDILVLGVRI